VPDYTGIAQGYPSVGSTHIGRWGADLQAEVLGVAVRQKTFSLAASSRWIECAGPCSCADVLGVAVAENFRPAASSRWIEWADCALPNGGVLARGTIAARDHLDCLYQFLGDFLSPR
jgi:hypothetical protein